MLRDNLVGLIEPMRNSAGADPLALSIQKQVSDDRSICLENPRPEGAESSLTENVTSPFQAEPAQTLHRSAYGLKTFLNFSPWIEFTNSVGVMARFPPAACIEPSSRYDCRQSYHPDCSSPA
jgi:hypothetical protein